MNKSEQEDRSPSQVLDPLYKLATCKIKRQKGNYFADIWSSSPALSEAFQDAKTLLRNAVLLNYPVPSAPLSLSTDASKTHLGASLDQWIDGAWRPLGFWSKSLQPSQQRYSTYLRELLAIKHVVRHFINDINGRSLTVFTDHKPILGSWKSPDLQIHDNVAMNAINEIAQWVTEIRYKPGKDLVVPDLLSRPFNSSLGTAHQVQDPEYIAPKDTLAALEAVAINVVSPEAIAHAQKACPDVQEHRQGNCPKSVHCQDIEVSGHTLYCEVSQPNNPRPLLPFELRSTVLNLLHHQDHPSAKETLRRASEEYYWPHQRSQVESFVRTCHPCQMGKQAPTVNPGVGCFPVPDQRFSTIHLDVVGPLVESNGYKYLLSILDRTSRWIECYPMKIASASECCRAFMEWASRYGLPRVAVSDNGNTFVANLYKDIMATFNVRVTFTPAYHPATNGAVERRHQTIKNSLKASLIDMGNEHGDKWSQALPWVLLGKRIQVQPDLDASAATLVFGKSLSIPGQLLGHPGPALSNIQTRALLETLYKMSAQPGLQTSTVVNPIDISQTDSATHVYVRVDEPRGLAARFEGPYPVISRPSRSTVQLRIGSYANGTPRLQVYHWSSCKIAHRREDAKDGERPKLGRRPDPDSPPAKTDDPVSEPSLSPEPPAPEPPALSSTRPARSTRNHNPQYVSSITSRRLAHVVQSGCPPAPSVQVPDVITNLVNRGRLPVQQGPNQFTSPGPSGVVYLSSRGPNIPATPA